jgi:hypothetical protein
MDERKDLVEEVTFTVHCVNGEKIIHRYKGPKTRKEAHKFNEDMANMIKAALAGKLPYMFFTNPSISYNPKNVVGIEMSPITLGEVETIMKEAQKRIGFKPD